MCTQAADDSGSNTGPGLTWQSRSISYTFQISGSRQLEQNSAYATLENAFGVWQNLSLAPNNVALCGSLPGTDLTFTKNTILSDATWVGYNYLDPNSNVNLLIFRDDAWSYGANTIDTVALTTATYSQLTGEIVDADIEFNSHDNLFSSDQVPTQGHYDLLNTAVHEIGHFIGLAHCGAVKCGNGEVMEPTANPEEIVKRQLKCDDRAAAVFKYPKGVANGYCNGANAATCGGCAPPTATFQIPQVGLLGQGTGRGGQRAPRGRWSSAGSRSAWQFGADCAAAPRCRHNHRAHPPAQSATCDVAANGGGGCFAYCASVRYAIAAARNAMVSRSSRPPVLR